MNESQRAYAYRIMLAASALATAYGVVDGDKAALWVAVGAALIGNGLATKNTSTKG